MMAFRRLPTLKDQRRGFYRMLLALLCMTFLLPAFAAEPVTDLRVLIDVSGSMKQNDPQNLRRPALKLLVGLIPDGTHAGVWTFGQFVNMQVKQGVVDQKWKQTATREAGNIHSYGLYTNIEDAIKRSTWDWNRPDESYNRHLILLTDGVVDISPDAKKNAKSRQTILNSHLQRLKQAGVKIHTIALSANADHELLKKLAVTTDGWYQQIESAGSLQRLFLHLFEKAAKPDTLPLVENRFVVDSSVKDMTLLVFRNKDSKPTRVLGPGNISYSQSNKPQGTGWLSEKGFDLITIKNPGPGDWRIDASAQFAYFV